MKSAIGWSVASFGLAAADFWRPPGPDLPVRDLEHDHMMIPVAVLAERALEAGRMASTRRGMHAAKGCSTPEREVVVVDLAFPL